MSEINLKKRVNTVRFQRALASYIINTHNLQTIMENGYVRNGGYLDYYLIYSELFTREEFEDNVKFCKSVEYLSKLIIKSFKTKTITVKQVLFWANADVIFRYRFHDPKFQKWQEHVFKILTFQDLSDKL